MLSRARVALLIIDHPSSLRDRQVHHEQEPRGKHASHLWIMVIKREISRSQTTSSKPAGFRGSSGARSFGGSEAEACFRYHDSSKQCRAGKQPKGGLRESADLRNQ